MSLVPQLPPGWSPSGCCVATILLSLFTPAKQYKEPHDRQCMKPLGLPVEALRKCGQCSVRAKSLSIEFSIISVQRKDRVSQKWVGMLRDWISVVRSTSQKFFRASKCLAENRVSGATGYVFLTGVLKVSSCGRRALLHGYLEYPSTSPKLLCLIMQLTPLQLPGV